MRLGAAQEGRRTQICTGADPKGIRTARQHPKEAQRSGAGNRTIGRPAKPGKLFNANRNQAARGSAKGCVTQTQDPGAGSDRPFVLRTVVTHSHAAAAPDPARRQRLLCYNLNVTQDSDPAGQISRNFETRN